MKKFMSMLLSVVTLVSGLSVAAFAQGETKPTASVYIRDPFVLTYDGKYYMYGTGAAHNGYGCYVSEDLENWADSKVVFEIPQDFWAYKDVWAGEVHKYKGKYYLFVSLLGKHGLRGTQIAVSDKPDGKFIPLVDRAVTPFDQSCIDGTLFVCDGKPFILLYRRKSQCLRKGNDDAKEY